HHIAHHSSVEISSTTPDILPLSLQDALPICEKVVGAAADGHLALDGLGLPALVECHDDGAGAVALDVPGLGEKVLLALFEAHRVDRKSTRLNSSHCPSSYTVFYLKHKIHHLY